MSKKRLLYFILCILIVLYNFDANIAVRLGLFATSLALGIDLLGRIQKCKGGNSNA